jgi:hypothetical protein
LQLQENSEEWNQFIEIIQNNIKKPEEKIEWKIKQIDLIINADFDLNFQSKIRELKLIVSKFCFFVENFK